MKIRRVTVAVRPPGTIFDEAAAAIGRIEAGKKVRAQREEICFSDVREMGKVLTPKRLEILKLVRDHRPASVRALAQLTGRNVKNVAEDLGLLVSLGLVDLQARGSAGRRKAPRVQYDTLRVEVHL